MPVVFTKTSLRGNAVMQMNLYNMLIGGGKYMINYVTTTNNKTISPNISNSLKADFSYWEQITIYLN